MWDIIDFPYVDRKLDILEQQIPETDFEKLLERANKKHEIERLIHSSDKEPSKPNLKLVK